METAYVRTMVRKKIPDKPRISNVEYDTSESDLCLVADLETDILTTQSKNVGFYQLWNWKKDILLEFGCFQNKDNLSEQDRKEIVEFCRQNNAKLMSGEEFIQNVFYKYVLFEHARYIGYNLLFDLPRLAVDARICKGKRFHHGFSLKMTEDKTCPRVKIKSKGRKFSLIEFGTSLRNPYTRYYRGRFVDCHTLAQALSGEKDLNLRKAGIRFGASEIKEETDEHGKINQKYLAYAARDVLCTYSLFKALMKELKRYNIDKNPERIFTEASLGKAIIKKSGVQNYIQQSSNVPFYQIASLMHTYYGGLAAIFCRKKPVEGILLDFTSMYPTINTLTGMDKFLIAKDIELVEATDEIQELLNKVTIEDTSKPEIYKQLCGYAILSPDLDRLPYRGNFNPKTKEKNIAICAVKYQGDWYAAIADLIASKLYTGKVPKITKAYKAIPIGVQENLKPITILGETYDLREVNIFQKLVEKKEELDIKCKDKSLSVEERERYASEKKVIKLIIVSVGYGIYVELNPEPTKCILEVYGDELFTTEGHYEKPGEAFNPAMGCTITSTARLFLAIIHKIVEDMGEKIAFCDTDSVFVPQKCQAAIQDFFNKLNPYKNVKNLMKKEFEEYDTLWFYGISTKRYVLYRIIDDDFDIVKYSAHGLGQIQNPFGKDEDDWHKRIWKDLLRLHYGKCTWEDLEQEYLGFPATIKLAISNFEMWKRVKKLNIDPTTKKLKPYSEQIKPGGFVLSSYGVKRKNGKIIRPIAPYTKDVTAAISGIFNNAENGDQMQGEEHWTTLMDVICVYAMHPEYKLEGDTGYLNYRTVYPKLIVYHGKESKRLENFGYDQEETQAFYNRRDTYKRLLAIKTPEAEKKGVLRGTLSKIKRKIRQGKTIKLDTPAIRRLLDL